jgi:hypothetical protein
MKTLQTILLGAALAGSYPAHALINDGKFVDEGGGAGELFIAVFDQAGQKSYYQDLGVAMDQFMAGQGCFVGHLAADPNYADFLAAQGLVYNIAAVNPLRTDQSNITAWGYLATSSQGKDIFNANFNAIDNTKQKIQGYIGNLNVLPFTNAPGQASENKSGVFQAGEPGFYGNPSWGSNFGQSVRGSTEGKPGEALDFFLVNNSNGRPDGEQVSKLGAWTLTSGGELSYSGTGTTAVCDRSSANQPPTAVIANPSQTVDVNAQVTLDGSGSSDPDNGPSPLTYQWVRTGGPDVTLTGADQAMASFTPAQAGNYVFQLTVSDGKDSSAPATATVTVSVPLPTGPFIRINAPGVFKVKQRQTINWITQQVDSKMTVKVQFSKGGGAKFKTLGTPKEKKKSFSFKPKKSFVTEQGVLQLCVKPAKKQAEVCDRQNVVVQP